MSGVQCRSLTQELRSVGTVELDGCACDLLGALRIKEADHTVSDGKLQARCSSWRINDYRTVSADMPVESAKPYKAVKLALPCTGTADLMLAPRKVLDIWAAAMMS